jgi:glycine cleavage system aminomethyltransferase T
VRFFGVIEFDLAGVRVTALRHGMTGGEGLEFWGPFEDRQRVLDTVLAAGAGFGLRRGGGRAYSSTAPWSGWLGSILPALYTGEDMRSFRRALPAAGFEGTLSLGGSFEGGSIDDWYMDPWDVGYDRFIHWDHAFHGRDALVARRNAPHRRKLWLHWHPEDVQRIFASHFGDGPRLKFLEWPSGQYANTTFDQVLLDGRPAGISANPTYTVHSGGWFSLGVLEPDAAVPGTKVTLIWGESGGGSLKPTVERHDQVEIRATVASGPVMLGRTA